MRVFFFLLEIFWGEVCEGWGVKFLECFKFGVEWLGFGFKFLGCIYKEYVRVDYLMFVFGGWEVYFMV